MLIFRFTTGLFCLVVAVFCVFVKYGLSVCTPLVIKLTSRCLLPWLFFLLLDIVLVVVFFGWSTLLMNSYKQHITLCKEKHEISFLPLTPKHNFYFLFFFKPLIFYRFPNRKCSNLLIKTFIKDSILTITIVVFFIIIEIYTRQIEKKK